MFQLKYSLAKIINSNATDIITVEGYEDLDIESETGTQYIQIKHSDNIEMYPGKMNGITKSMKAMIQRGIKESDKLIFVQKKKEYIRGPPKIDQPTFNKKLYDAVTTAQKPYVSKQPQQAVEIDKSYNYAQHYIPEYYDHKSIKDIQIDVIQTIMEQQQLSERDAIIMYYCIEMFVMEHLGEAFTKEDFNNKVKTLYNTIE